MVLCIFILVTTPDSNAPSDGDITRQGAFLVNLVALDGLLGHLEAQTNALVVPWKLLFASFSKQDPLLILKDSGLLLVGTLNLMSAVFTATWKKSSH